MPSLTGTGQCPHWCAREHCAEPGRIAFYHAGETSSVSVSRACGPGEPERVDVQAAQYLPDDPGEPGLVTRGGGSRAYRRPVPADRADAGRSAGTGRDARGRG